MRQNRWLILAVLFLARTAMGFQYQSVGSVSALLVADLHIDFARLGALIGLYLLPGVILALPGGGLGQRFGEKRMVLLAVALMAFGGLLLGTSDSYSWAVAGRLVSGVGGVLLNILLTKMVADWFAEHEIITAMAVLVTSWPLGIALALIALGPLASVTTWALAMNLTAVACLVVLILVKATYNAPPIATNREAAQFTRLTLSSQEMLLAVLSGLIWMLFNVGYAILPGFGPSFLLTTGHTLAEAGSLVSVASWILVISLPLGGYLGERLKRPNLILVICFMGIGVATCLLPYVDNPLVLLVVLGLLFGPPAGIIVALPVQVLRPENRAPGLGIFYTCYYGGVAALTPSAGYFRDLTNNSAAPLVFGGILLFVAVAVLWVFRFLQEHGARGSFARAFTSQASEDLVK